jgi:hypothetical protein
LVAPRGFNHKGLIRLNRQLNAEEGIRAEFVAVILPRRCLWQSDRLKTNCEDNNNKAGKGAGNSNDGNHSSQQIQPAQELRRGRRGC